MAEFKLRFEKWPWYWKNCGNANRGLRIWWYIFWRKNWANTAAIPANIALTLFAVTVVLLLQNLLVGLTVNDLEVSCSFVYRLWICWYHIFSRFLCNFCNLFEILLFKKKLRTKAVAAHVANRLEIIYLLETVIMCKRSLSFLELIKLKNKVVMQLSLVKYKIVEDEL